MQQRDHYTSVEHFLDDESFQIWVLAGKDQHRWEEWTVDNQQRAKLVEEARLWLLAMRVPDEKVSRSEVQEALQGTWLKIRSMEHGGGASTRYPFWKQRAWWAAASVLLLGMLLWGMYQAQSDRQPEDLAGQYSPQNQTALVEKVNTTDHPLLIMLSDGSSVLLQPRSTLRYPPKFDDRERKVYLSGDGFFEVSKNPEKPFYVYANELVTQVVGTSFRVKAFSNQKNVEVVVRTGKVHVTSKQSGKKSENEAVLLLPNQGVRFARQSGIFEKIEDLTQEKNLTRDLSNIEKLSFEFADVPVAQIFKTIEQAYLVKIDFPSEKLADCYLTTSLNDQPLSEKLKIICESLGRRTSYQMNENQITIHSDGCN
jgi:transmembrane sensor